MKTSYAPRTYRIPTEFFGTIVTVPVNPQSGEWIAFLISNPQLFGCGPGEADAVWNLLEKMVMQQAPTGEEILQPQHPGTLPRGEASPDTIGQSTETTEAAFIWLPEMVEMLKQDVATLRTQAPRRTMASIIREIADRHGWPLSAVNYKVYHLGLHRQPVPPLALVARTERADELAVGGVIWEVRIDGIPMKCNLAYAHGDFPYARATPVILAGKRYRITRVGRSWLDLTSEAVETAEVQLSALAEV